MTYDSVVHKCALWIVRYFEFESSALPRFGTLS
jgi:hypothetical protein